MIQIVTSRAAKETGKYYEHAKASTNDSTTQK